MAIGSALAAAAISAAGGLYSASQQSKAAKSAANAATTASDQNIAEQQRQYNQTRQDNLPFMQSDLARRAMADRSYGIQGTPTAMQSDAQAYYGGNAGMPDFGAYVRNNPDLLAAYNASGGQYGGLEDFGQIHFYTHGQGEGRQLPLFQAQQQQQQQPAANTPFDPLSDFNRSADAALLNYAPIRENVNAMFSAKGQGLDGAAIKALQDRTTNYTQNAFYNWRSGLEGSPTGAADKTNAAGQNMASQNAQNRVNAANAMASSYQQRADANSAAAGVAAGAFGSWANKYGWGK